MAIYPSFNAGYTMSKEDCISVAVNCRQPWAHVVPMMPAVGGRIAVDRIGELTTALGRDIVFMLGSRVQQDDLGVVTAIEEFLRVLTKSPS